MKAAEHASGRRVVSQQKRGERLLSGDRRRYNGGVARFQVASGSLLTRRQNYAMQTEHGLRILRQWNPNSPCPLIAGVIWQTSMAAPAWKLEELIATLTSGVSLPGEPTGDPPWPKSFDDEYRRITSANCIARDFGNEWAALEALREYATSGDNSVVRCRCVTLLGQMGAIDKLVESLIDDPEPELRLYAIEYILVNHPSRFPELETLFKDDQDWQIKETLECFRRGNDIPLFQYEMPDNNCVNRSGESGGN